MLCIYSSLLLFPSPLFRRGSARLTSPLLSISGRLPFVSIYDKPSRPCGVIDVWIYNTDPRTLRVLLSFMGFLRMCGSYLSVSLLTSLSRRRRQHMLLSPRCEKLSVWWCFSDLRSRPICAPRATLPAQLRQPRMLAVVPTKYFRKVPILACPLISLGFSSEYAVRQILVPSRKYLLHSPTGLKGTSPTSVVCAV